MTEIIAQAHGCLDTGLLCAILYKMGGYQVRIVALERWIKETLSVHEERITFLERNI